MSDKGLRAYTKGVVANHNTMNKLNVHKTAVAFGVTLGGWHLVWSVLVALGWAQSIMDFVLWAHMIHFTYVAGPFDFSAALTLIIITGLIGYVMGLVFARAWNWAHRG